MKTQLDFRASQSHLLDRLQHYSDVRHRARQRKAYSVIHHAELSIRELRRRITKEL